MKNWKHYGIIGFFLILLFVFIFIACDDNNDNQDTYTEIGTLEGTYIKIYKHSSVTTEQANIAVNMFNELYTYGFSDSRREKFKVNITDIRIGPTGTIIGHNGSILTISWNDDGNSLVPYLVPNGLA